MLLQKSYGLIQSVANAESTDRSFSNEREPFTSAELMAQDSKQKSYKAISSPSKSGQHVHRSTTCNKHDGETGEKRMSFLQFKRGSEEIQRTRMNKLHDETLHSNPTLMRTGNGKQTVFQAIGARLDPISLKVSGTDFKVSPPR